LSFCTRCGQPVGGTLKFCTNCGARRPVAGREDTPVTPAPAGAPPPRAVTPPPPGWAQRPEPQRPEPAYPEPEDLEPPTLTTGYPPARTAGPFSRPPAPPGPGRRRIPAWGIIAAAVVLAAAAAGGWYAATQHGSTAAATGQRPPSAKPSTGGGGSPAATSPSSQLATPTGSPASSTPAGSPATSAPAAGGGSQVALGPGVSGQTAGSVAAFASQYFAAVNRHDYQAYIGLFAPGADPGMSAQKFQAGYASTTDSSETLVALAGTASGKTAASLTFVSHQGAASSATHTTCTSWRITLYLVPSGTSYLISHPPASYHASFQPCS
jgi:hypothetical protein